MDNLEQNLNDKVKELLVNYKKFTEKNDINSDKTIDLRISNRLIIDHEEGA